MDERGLEEQVSHEGDMLSQAIVRRLLGRITAAPSDNESFDLVAPFTQQRIASIPKGTPADIEEAARRARKAQVGWAETAPSSRRDVFLRFHDLLLDRQKEILDIIQLESGKARFAAFEEVVDVANTCRYYAIHGIEQIKPVRRRGAVPGLTTAREYRHPVGVVGIISPWNYPLTLSISDAIPALIAGNAVILKPDRQTPLTALWAVDLLFEAGLPEDLFQVVTGEGSLLGGPLIDSVDYITFTGSTKTGRTVAAKAGENLIGCSLELGGKNSLIVLHDADVELAAEGAVRACFSNAGQLCISFERILVSSDIAASFLDRFVSLTKAMRLGSALDFGFDMGSISSARQLQTIRDHLEDALEKGARVLAGGQTRPDLGPLFHEPTILCDVKPGMKAYEEETFGPLVSVFEFGPEEEAVKFANATSYGLNASIWSKDVARARKLARRIEAGSVNINDGYVAAWGSMDAPMGGFKSSGLGRRHGAEGILKYTEAQTIAQQLTALPLRPPRLISEGMLAAALTSALKLWRRVPIIR